MAKQKPFVSITNQQIYDKIVNLEENNEKAHQEIKDLVALRIKQVNDQQSICNQKIANHAGSIKGIWVTIGILATALLADLGWLFAHIS